MGAEDWDDPHDIIPEQFRERFGDSETVADALQRAAASESSTPDSQQPCCPECYSVCVTPKADSISESTNRRDGAWKCTECWSHFSEPLDMNPNATAFEWIDTDELADPDERGETPLFGTLDERTRTALAIALCQPWHEPGASYREAAVFFPHSRYWIGRRVRAWKDGEYRDLVPDPTAADVEPAPSNDPPIDPRAAVARIGGDYEELVAERAGNTDASSDTGAVATDGGRRSRWGAYGSD